MISNRAAQLTRVVLKSCSYRFFHLLRINAFRHNDSGFKNHRSGIGVYDFTVFIVRIAERCAYQLCNILVVEIGTDHLPYLIQYLFIIHIECISAGQRYCYSI